MPALLIRGESFECHDELGSWALVKLAKATVGDDQQVALAGFYDLVSAVMAPDEFARFDAYLMAHPIPFNEFNEAIGGLMASYNARPTAQPSPSSAGTSTTEQQRRVVSLSPKGRTPEPSSTDGALAAS